MKTTRRYAIAARALLATFWCGMACLALLCLPWWAGVPAVTLDAVLFTAAVWGE